MGAATRGLPHEQHHAANHCDLSEQLLQLAILLAQLSSWCPQGSEQVTDRDQGSYS